MFSTSLAQAYALVRRGELRAIKLGGRGQWRVEMTEIEAYIERAWTRPPSTSAATRSTTWRN